MLANAFSIKIKYIKIKYILNIRALYIRNLLIFVRYLISISHKS